MDFSRDGRWLAVGGSDSLSLIAANEGKQRVILPTDKSRVSALQWLQTTSAALICAFEDGSIFSLSLDKVCKSQSCTIANNYAYAA